MAASRQAAQKISLIKRGWNEIPEVMFSGVISVFGLVLAGVGAYKWKQLGPNAGKYKLSYSVIRDTDVKDDPTLEKYN